MVDTNKRKTCVITESNNMKCWAYNLKPHIISDFKE